MVCMCYLLFYVFFFFKQKTAYEMLRSLVGSEMCIRDSVRQGAGQVLVRLDVAGHPDSAPGQSQCGKAVCRCLLYTSDAADDLLCVDLGGRRIIKKKKKIPHRYDNSTTITNHYHAQNIV